MTTRTRLSIGAVSITALFLAVVVTTVAGQQPAAKAGEWPRYGLDHRETRYSPLTRITAANVKDLGLAWTYAMGPGGGNQEGTPLVWNNTLYGITTWSVVFALDAKTGKERWRWDPQVDQPKTRPAICCGNVNRGLAIYNNWIIAPAIDGRLFALDAKTGKPVWQTRIVDSGELYTITMAPRIAGDKVIVGAAGGDRPTRGQFVALDAKTGKLAWRFYTVPGDPSRPPENEAMRVAAKTWGGEFWKNGGGASVWDGFAYDPDANLVYVGTSNPQPWVEKFRGAKGLDNLYSCSILAVDLTTGQLKWYYQAVPNDNWDYDNTAQLMLLDLPVQGRTRKVIVQAPKNGFFYILDRVTGEFLSAEPFVKVSWALGMTPEGRPIVNPKAYYDQEAISIYPTSGGAHNWSPMSYNPNTGLVYIPAFYTSFNLQAQAEFRPGTTGFERPNGPTRVVEPTMGPEPPAGARSGLQAWDPVAQKLRWNVEGGGGIGGGTTTTAGNLVFQVINDGRFRALSADKGEILYQLKVPRTGMAPPITYAIDGEQYVAFAGGIGGGATVQTGAPAPATNTPLLFVFKLGGTAKMPEAAPAAAPASPVPPAGPAPEQQQ